VAKRTLFFIELVFGVNITTETSLGWLLFMLLLLPAALRAAQVAGI